MYIGNILVPVDQIPVLLTLPEQSRSSSVFSVVRVAQSLVFCVVFCRSLFVFSDVRVVLSLVFCVVFCRSLFVFSDVRVVLSLVFCVVFVDHCLFLVVFVLFYL